MGRAVRPCPPDRVAHAGAGHRTGLAAADDAVPAGDCAISRGVDVAVGIRVPAIVGRVSPVGLAAHIAATIGSGLSGGTWLCRRKSPDGSPRLPVTLSSMAQDWTG